MYGGQRNLETSPVETALSGKSNLLWSPIHPLQFPQPLR